MKKNIKFLIICSIVISCVNDVRRIPMEAYIFDSQTKKPLVDVKIVQFINGKRKIIAKTNLEGYFTVEKSTKLSVGMQQHKLGNLFFLEKKGYKVDTVETYGGVNDFYKKDSIFLKYLETSQK